MTWGVVLVAVLAVIVLAVVLLSDGNSADPEATQATSQLTPSQADSAVSVPALITPPPCVPPADWVIHTVGEGDTLFGIVRFPVMIIDTPAFQGGCLVNGCGILNGFRRQGIVVFRISPVVRLEDFDLSSRKHLDNIFHDPCFDIADKCFIDTF